MASVSQKLRMTEIEEYRMDRKHEVLEKYFGYTEFRSGQEVLIDGILAGRDVLGIMPTGSGKSICYQIPAIMMEGITLVISPLISLMKDQVSALIRIGVPAAFINSSLTAAQIRTAYKRCQAGNYKIIYVAPERLLTCDFYEAIRNLKISMVAVDEAHCISQWGQDFRPSYLKIREFMSQLSYQPVVSAFTATATETVAEDIVNALQLQNPVRVVTGFDRPNLHFEVRRPKDKPEALLKLMDQEKGKSGIIYCSTRKDTESVCELLTERGYLATKYHAGLSEEERRKNQDDFLYDQRPIMVATNAFGMGIDKSNVGFVIHYNMPKCIEAYYQEAGRAGRDGTAADCILFYAGKDVTTAKFLIQTPAENTELTQEQQERIWQQDYVRLDQMVGYCSTSHCLRGYILQYFGQAHGENCGNCGNCQGSFTEQNVTAEARIILSCLEEVRTFLGYYLGEGLVIKLLRGRNIKRIQQMHLDQLSSSGKLQSLAEETIIQIISELKEQKLVRINHNHETLEPTGKKLPDDAVVCMRLTSRPETASVGKSAPVNSSRMEQLKALRMKLAQAEKVPAYIVFSNATLEDMARREPKTMEEFLQVSGVGAYKAERYGDAFLKLFCKSTE